MPKKKQTPSTTPDKMEVPGGVRGLQESEHTFVVTDSTEAEKLLNAIRLDGSSAAPKSLFRDGSLFARPTIRVVALKSAPGEDITHWLLAECRGCPDVARDGFSAFGFSGLSIGEVRGLCQNVLAGLILLVGQDYVSVLPDDVIFPVLEEGGDK